MSFDAIFFDFDGVLVDSEPVHFRCWREVLEPFEIDLDWTAYARDCIGVSDIDMLNYLAGRSRRQMVGEDLRPVYQVKKRRFLEMALELDLVGAETLDLMRSLDGLPIAVVTSSGRTEVEPILARTGVLPLLATAVYGEDAPRRKPAPDPYQLAARRTGARRPLVVEDSDAGAASARAAGFDLVRVATAAEVPAKVRQALQQV
ncbi:MAG: HAD family hydrolase [Bryobacteraceae bacterium]